MSDMMRWIRKWKATKPMSSQSVSGRGNCAFSRSTAKKMQTMPRIWAALPKIDEIYRHLYKEDFHCAKLTVLKTLAKFKTWPTF
jgi:hypothetical protein